MDEHIIRRDARGDIDRELLTQGLSEWELRRYLYNCEQLQYIGRSEWGLRVIDKEVHASIGRACLSVITDKQIILVASHRENSSVRGYDCIYVLYSEIEEVHPNDGITKSSIKITTGDEFEIDSDAVDIFTVKTSDPDIEGNVSGPVLKFRFRRGNSGANAKEISHYIQEKIDDPPKSPHVELYQKAQSKSEQIPEKNFYLPSPDETDDKLTGKNAYNVALCKIRDWKEVAEKKKTVTHQVRQLDRPLYIPSYGIFRDPETGKQRYDELSEEIKDWKKAAEKRDSAEDLAKQLDFDFDVPSLITFEDPQEGMCAYEELSEEIEEWKEVEKIYEQTVKSLEESLGWGVQTILEPEYYSDPLVAKEDYADAYDSALQAKRQLKRLHPEFNERRRLVKQLICKHYSRMECEVDDPLIRIIRSIPEPDEFDSQINARDRYDNVVRDIKRIQTIIEVTNRYCKLYPELPFDTFLDAVISDCATGSPLSSQEIENWYEVITKTQEILDFLSSVDTHHPSVPATEWHDSITIALKQGFPNVLRPIHNNIENMDNGLWTRSDFDAYSWKEFEDLIGILYKSQGYDTEVTSKTADMGVDVWATGHDERLAIQAKQYAQENSVGRESLQKLSSMLAKGEADRVIIVTTSTFTWTAREWSTDFGPGINLVNGEDLINLLNKSEIPSPA